MVLQEQTYASPEVISTGTSVKKDTPSISENDFSGLDPWLSKCILQLLSNDTLLRNALSEAVQQGRLNSQVIAPIFTEQQRFIHNRRPISDSSLKEEIRQLLGLHGLKPRESFAIHDAEAEGD